MNPYLAFLVGVACAAVGGELFVRGAVGLARWARISAGIVAATVVAFATSSPELTVSVTSALAGSPNIALGDALGSNVVNITLILGIAVAFSRTETSPSAIRRDYPVALLGPVLLAVLAADGELSRIDGLVLLTVFVGWILAVVAAVQKQRRETEEATGAPRHGLIVVQSVAGLALLILAGRFIVDGAREIAVAFGLDEFIVGATVVAIGTGAPELATTIIAKVRGYDDVSLGTILGSNIFNGFLVIGIAALIAPFAVNLSRVGAALLFGAIAVAAIAPGRSAVLKRRRGVLLLSSYAVYLAVVLLRHY